jgi:DNA end-binding protein Ku
MPAPSSTRTLWKGAISFGLVHIPITLHSATAENRMKFNLLDKRTMNPVGNKQVNKATGEAMTKEEVVKGFEYEKDQYVVLSPEEIKAALPKSTQTIEIEAFIDGSQIPTTYYNKPYYVAPASKGQKPYLLLLETMRRTGKVGIARVVISTRQHLAALMPAEEGLVLELLRWEDEVRDTAGLPLPDSDTKVSEKELKMAEQLVNDLEDDWKPEAFHDEFREKLEQVVEQKVKAGEGEHIMKPLEGEEVKTSADIIDLTELLKRSLRKGGKADAEEAAPKTASRRKAANDEEAQARPRRAAASKSGTRATATVKAKPRKKAA